MAVRIEKDEITIKSRFLYFDFISLPSSLVVSVSVFMFSDVGTGLTSKYSGFMLRETYLFLSVSKYRRFSAFTTSFPFFSGMMVYSNFFEK